MAFPPKEKGPALVIGVDAEPEGDMPMGDESMDPRMAAAKALMSALKSGDAARFADAFDEMLMSADSEQDEEMPAEDSEGELPPF